MKGSSASCPVGAINSLLFVSGATPARFAGALAADTDLVCIDLEDSVPASGKDDARTAALAFPGHARLAVRINPLATKAGLADLLALEERAAPPPAAVLLPMVESADELRIAAAILPGVPLVPLIETPAGLRHAHAIAAASGVAAMMFGGADLAAALGVAMEWEPLLAARGAFLLACAHASRAAIDVPFVRLDDPAGLAAESARAKALGFAAKAAVHPRQLDAINLAFRPDPALLAEARAARAAFEAAGGRAVRFAGRILEAPIMQRYERMLAMAERRADA